MEEFISYLIKSLIISGALTSYYWIFLRNKKFNYYNRFYLLATLVISLLAPLLNLDFYEVRRPDSEWTVNLLSLISRRHIPHNEADLHNSGNELFVILILLVSLLLLSALLMRVGSLYLYARKHPVIKGNGFRLIETDLSEAPFSFLHFLFWKRNMDFGSEESQLILKHELTHIRQRHTYDILFSRILVCIFWMNPFYWIIRKELSLIHEFIADDKSVGQGNGAMFAKMLLVTNYEGKFMDPTHSFFHSPIKRRLFMITNAENSKYNYLSRVLILPVITIILFILSFNIARGQSEPSKTDSEKIIKVNDEKNSKAFDQYHPEGHTPSEKEVKALIESILDNPPQNRIYFINDQRVSPEKVKKLKYSMITDTRLLPPAESLEKFGVTGEKGTISFLLKK